MSDADFVGFDREGADPEVRKFGGTSRTVPRTGDGVLPIVHEMEKYRRFIGMSVTQCAARMGMKTAKQVYYIEVHSGPLIGAATLIRYAEALGLSLRLQVEEQIDIDPLLDSNGYSRNAETRGDVATGEVWAKFGAKSGVKKNMNSLRFWDNEAT